MDNLTPLKSRGLTWIRKMASAHNCTVIVRTVTTGKKFYWLSCSVTGAFDTFNGQYAQIILRDTDDNMIGLLCRIGVSVNGQSAGIEKDFTIPFEIPAGWDICLEATGDAWANAFIVGWEE